MYVYEVGTQHYNLHMLASWDYHINALRDAKYMYPCCQPRNGNEQNHLQVPDAVTATNLPFSYDPVLWSKSTPFSASSSTYALGDLFSFTA